MSKRNLQTFMVKIASGGKISVPRFEFVRLDDSMKVRITKVSPFNSLLTHKFVVKGEKAKAVASELNILIPELPDEAHGTWNKDIWLIIETRKENAIACRLVHDFGEEKQFFNVYQDEESAGGREFTRLRFVRLFESRIFISDNYENALPIVTSYRKCPFCSSHECLIEQGAGIPTFCEDNLSKYKKGYSIEYNVCKKHKKGFIIALQRKNVSSTNKVVCHFCGSQSPVRINASDMPDLLAASRFQEMLLEEKRKGPNESEKKNKMDDVVKEFNDLLVNNPDLFKNLYECKQCLSVFDSTGKVLLRPHKLDL